MNERSDMSRVLGHWFDEGPATMPDRVVDVVADRIARERQRPARRLPWRPIHMTPSWKLEAVAASIIVVLAVGWMLQPRGGPSPGVVPLATPGATSAPSASAQAAETHTAEQPGTGCEDDAPDCAGVLDPGSHTTAAFRPGLSFQVPGGWENTLDTRNTFVLHPFAAGGSDIRMWSNANIPEEVGCNLTVAPGESRAADWVDFINATSALSVIDQQPMTMGEGQGWMIDLEVAPDWRASCPGLPGPYLVQFIVDDYATPYGIASSDRMRLYVVDVGDGTVLAWSYGRVLADLYEDTFRSNTRVFDSMRFESAP